MLFTLLDHTQTKELTLNASEVISRSENKAVILVKKFNTSSFKDNKSYSRLLDKLNNEAVYIYFDPNSDAENSIVTGHSIAQSTTADNVEVLTIFFSNKRYKTSANVYSHNKHIHWLETSDLPPSTKKKIKGVCSRIFRGYSMTNAQTDFMQSLEYNHAQHKLDVLSGEYPKLFKQEAKQLMIAQGLIKAEDWDKFLPPNRRALPIEYNETSKCFTKYDEINNKDVSVSLDDVLKFVECSAH